MSFSISYKVKWPQALWIFYLVPLVNVLQFIIVAAFDDTAADLDTNRQKAGRLNCCCCFKSKSFLEQVWNYWQQCWYGGDKQWVSPRGVLYCCLAPLVSCFAVRNIKASKHFKAGQNDRFYTYIYIYIISCAFSATRNWVHLLNWD